VMNTSNAVRNVANVYCAEVEHCPCTHIHLNTVHCTQNKSEIHQGESIFGTYERLANWRNRVSRIGEYTYCFVVIVTTGAYPGQISGHSSHTDTRYI
jgi:hypothetical protein